MKFLDMIEDGVVWQDPHSSRRSNEEDNRQLRQLRDQGYVFIGGAYIGPENDQRWTRCYAKPSAMLLSLPELNFPLGSLELTSVKLGPAAQCYGRSRDMISHRYLGEVTEIPAEFQFLVKNH